MNTLLMFIRLGGRVFKALDCYSKTVCVRGFKYHFYRIVFQRFQLCVPFVQPYRFTNLKFELTFIVIFCTFHKNAYYYDRVVPLKSSIHIEIEHLKI